MDKRPILLRTIIALAVLVIFISTTYPLGQKDYFDTFKSLVKKDKQPQAEELVQAAEVILDENRGMYQSDALLRAAAPANAPQIDLVEIVEGKDLQNNRDVIAMIRREAASSIRLGIDLNGGAEFILNLKSDKADVTDDEKARNQDLAIEVIRRRMESQQIYETEISPTGNLISLKVPVASKEEKVKLHKLIEMSAKLRFRLVHPTGHLNAEQVQTKPPAGYELMKEIDSNPAKYFWVEKNWKMDGKNISQAQIRQNQYGQREISLTFNNEGVKDFGRLTEANIGRQLAIVLDGDLYCAPTIQTAIYGPAQITGSFTTEEMQNICNALNAGGIGFQIEVVSVYDVDPTLGADNVRNGIWAGIASLILVLIFLLFYYRLAGLVAAIALSFNVILVLGAMAAFGATLTLPGIAGIILTIGMAVDINVLIFERLREEMATGKSLSAALDTAYGRVLPVVIDANLTAFFTSMILYYFGSGAIKGFAITFCIGICTSIFTGVFLTRLCFDIMCQKLRLTKLHMMSFLKPGAHYNYLGKWRICAVVSGTLILATIITLAVNGKNSLNIDFTGGTLLSYDYEEAVPRDELINTLKSYGYDARVVYKSNIGAVGDTKRLEILMRDSNKNSDKSIIANLHQDIMDRLNEAYPQVKLSGGEETNVGGLVGYEFSKSAIISVLLAFLGMAIYISLRYEFAYAMAGILALVHDIIIAVGIYLWCGREISLVVIAAILTIIGYSINDTIVVFDRIRENIRLKQANTYQEIINLSINQTMARTILTSASTSIVLFVLFIAGGIAINDFVLVMLLGVIIGTYSSIFVASPIVAFWHRKRIGVGEDLAELTRHEAPDQQPQQ